MSDDPDTKVVVRDRLGPDFFNDGPFDDDELVEHVQRVADVVQTVEAERRGSQRATEVRPEGEGHGVMVKCDWFDTAIAMALFDAGYVVSSSDGFGDEQRIFIMPVDEGGLIDPYPDAEHTGGL